MGGQIQGCKMGRMSRQPTTIKIIAVLVTIGVVRGEGYAVGGHGGIRNEALLPSGTAEVVDERNAEATISKQAAGSTLPHDSKQQIDVLGTEGDVGLARATSLDGPLATTTKEEASEYNGATTGAGQMLVQATTESVDTSPVAGDDKPQPMDLRQPVGVLARLAALTQQQSEQPVQADVPVTKAEEDGGKAEETSDETPAADGDAELIPLDRSDFSFDSIKGLPSLDKFPQGGAVAFSSASPVVKVMKVVLLLFLLMFVLHGEAIEVENNLDFANPHAQYLGGDLGPESLFLLHDPYGGEPMFGTITQLIFLCGIQADIGAAAKAGKVANKQLNSTNDDNGGVGKYGVVPIEYRPFTGRHYLGPDSAFCGEIFPTAGHGFPDKTVAKLRELMRYFLLWKARDCGMSEHGFVVDNFNPKSWLSADFSNSLTLSSLISNIENAPCRPPKDLKKQDSESQVGKEGSAANVKRSSSAVDDMHFVDTRIASRAAAACKLEQQMHLFVCAEGFGYKSGSKSIFQQICKHKPHCSMTESDASSYAEFSQTINKLLGCVCETGPRSDVLYLEQLGAEKGYDSKHSEEKVVQEAKKVTRTREESAGWIKNKEAWYEKRAPESEKPLDYNSNYLDQSGKA